ncbi:TPA: hypothetical protein ACU8BI_000602 [Neisseria subflava]
MTQQNRKTAKICGVTTQLNLPIKLKDEIKMSKPKISLNKLGEYLDATPSRRKRIIQDQQNPQVFKAVRYQDARECITEYISNEMLDDAGLLESAQKLRAVHDCSDFILQDKRASADAIEQFLDIADSIDLEGLKAEKVDKTNSSIMEIGGVDVSIRPDVILKDSETGDVKGAVKLHFPKSNPLSDKSAGYVATALKVYLGGNNSKIDPLKCYLIDIPSQKVVSAGKAHKKKMNDIEAACEEIEARWKREEEK